MKTIKTVQILNNYRRLKNIRRCNNFLTIQTEDVAQHSFYTTIIAMTIAEEYNKAVEEWNNNLHPLDVDNLMEPADVNKVIKLSLFHDMEEVFTSDIPYNVKHYNKDLNSSIKECIKHILTDVYDSSTISHHKFYILNCKEGLEGKFVAISDLLEGAWYCYQEILMGNNYIKELFNSYLIEINKLEFLTIMKEKCPTVKRLLNLFENFQPDINLNENKLIV